MVDSFHNKLSSENQNRLVQFLELFKGRKLIIFPQVLLEIYSLFKREAKGTDSKVQNWLKILDNPHLKNLVENYIQKEIIVLIKSMNNNNNNNILLTKDYA